MNAGAIRTVMLIDDDPVSNKICQLFLRKHGWSVEVTAFEDPLQALQTLHDATGKELLGIPDVILLDVGMPVYDGWDFLDEYEKLPRERMSQTLLYMLSSSINPPDIQKAGNYWAVKSYITKPLTFEALSLIVADHCALRQARGVDPLQG